MCVCVMYCNLSTCGNTLVCIIMYRLVRGNE